MWSGFGMDGDDVRTSIGKCLDIGIHWRNHEMNIHDGFDMGPKGLHHSWANGDVGHIMAIHHIHMNPIAASFFNRPNLFTKPGEIS